MDDNTPAAGGTEDKNTTEHGKADTAVKVSAGKDAIAAGTEAGAAKPDQPQGSETADQTPDMETPPETIPETSADAESKTDVETSALPAAKETSEPVPTDASEPTDADEPAIADEPAVDSPAEQPKSHAKAKENLSLVWTFISTFIVACIVIIAAALVAVKISGCYLFTVQMGSMTPTYPVNTVVLVKPYASISEVQVGDVVTYLLDESGTTVTHRVVSIDTASEKLTTKGDANASPDAAQVLYGNVIGKVVVGIPNIGKVVKVVAAEENRNTVIAVIVIILAALVLSDLIKSIRRRRNKKNKKQKQE